MIENITLQNDYIRLQRLGNPKYFTANAVPCSDPSVELLVRCVLRGAATMRVTGWDQAPQPADGGVFYIYVYKPYPQGGVKVLFLPQEGMPYNIHVYRSGEVCFDGWNPRYSSLAQVAEKVIRCMLFDPAAFHYDPTTHALTSIANTIPLLWVQQNMARFPLFPPERVLRREVLVRGAAPRAKPVIHTAPRGGAST